MKIEMSKPTPIRKLLASLIAAKGWEGRIALHDVFVFWDDVVGADIARQAQPHVIRKTILWVRVSDSVWMQQLHLLKGMLLEKINGRLEKSQFTDLRFQLDSTLGHGEQAGEQPSARPFRAPSPARKKEFETLLDSIEDDEIKAAIRRCWLKTGHLRDSKETDSL